MRQLKPGIKCAWRCIEGSLGLHYKLQIKMGRRFQKITELICMAVFRFRNTACLVFLIGLIPERFFQRVIALFWVLLFASIMSLIRDVIKTLIAIQWKDAFWVTQIATVILMVSMVLGMVIREIVF
jgi:hypothetical protein